MEKEGFLVDECFNCTLERAKLHVSYYNAAPSPCHKYQFYCRYTENAHRIMPFQDRISLRGRNADGKTRRAVAGRILWPFHDDGLTFLDGVSESDHCAENLTVFILGVTISKHPVGPWSCE